MLTLTHLDYLNNGTRACGKRTDNNRGDHTVLEGLAGTTIEYGDDIDHMAAMGEGEEVLASGTVSAAGDDCDLEIPVVVVHDPE